MKQSSYLREISYDQKTKQMTVMFNDGAVIAYFNVHPRTYAAIDRADSVGAKFIQLVQNHRFDIVKPAA